ncbi:type 3 dihydrofolate reductase [Testudinibacter sp. P27/CKL/0425]
MQISLIVAFTQNRVIGKDNQMPWHLPRDLAWFKRNTLNRLVIMGRKTFESIGRPLPNRTNIVLSRNPFVHHGVQWADSLPTALERCRDVEEVMIIGGGELFKQSLPLADKLYLTEIQTALEGDTFFPQIDFNQWKLVSEEYSQADDNNRYDCRFMILEKQK